MLKGSHKKKDKAPINCNEQAEAAFRRCKESLARATLLACPNPTAELALTTDASDKAIGAVLEQCNNENWQPLAFYSKRLKAAEVKCNAYDRELLAIYAATKHFRHMLEGREFSIYTDHKPLIYAFQQNLLQSSLRQARHLSYVGQFSTEIRHVAGRDNAVADALSRVEEIKKAVNMEDLARSQGEEEELQRIQKSENSLILESRPILGTSTSILCDMTTKRARPYVTAPFRSQIFHSLHDMAHPGVKLRSNLYKKDLSGQE